MPEMWHQYDEGMMFMCLELKIEIEEVRR